ncbi:MAG TPA: enoyl-CoA hydratase [Dehalococcoidia bacterium]
MNLKDLRYERQGHVAVITLDRPDRLNAISQAMVAGLAEAFRTAADDRDVRCVVLTGAGKGFCSGLDLKEAAAGPVETSGQAGLRPFNGRMVGLGDFAPIVLHQLDKPVIAAVNGAAAGWGLDLALACDLRIAAAGAKLGLMFAKRGVVPDGGGTWLLPRLVGWAKAAELVFLGEVITAEQGLAYGLVNRVVPQGEVLPEAMRWAEAIAANSPLAVQTAKRLMRQGLNEPFAEHVDRVVLALQRLFQSRDFQEGVQAFVERREPVFEGR